MITLHYYKEGNINEYFSPAELPEVYGMSGSLVFSYRPRDVLFPYGLLGVVNRGTQNSETLWLTPVDDVINFIETAYFNTEDRD
ncbi:hypothetical protein O9H85_35100 [Paenibacillus filicis]|uniref:Uncharacterized protein n=1 Tax=Paenibacillus gyeongsangnamensis TaxID=3388067 RepID=A0ABT4QKT2_9BACL|nr:hypothetical protein [Paenibacillus filicis]MCZ8517478.1 hypothetical protein [Paenibacillus filicis]